LRVSDNGCGMSPETLAHVFEPFYTTKDVGAGTGLGLATVFGIMGQHGGFIDVKTAPGAGTTFGCYFPRTTKQAATGSDSEHALPRGTETVLLVEDETSVREATAEMLRSLGYTVLQAPGGAEAMVIAALATAPIQLLLSDVIMPDMLGTEVRDALRARDANLRVLFMSGYAGDAANRQGMSEPGMRFLQKPFTMRALAEEVRMALDGPLAKDASDRSG
jgi:CheY-like chemotaxis protein